MCFVLIDFSYNYFEFIFIYFDLRLNDQAIGFDVPDSGYSTHKGTSLLNGLVLLSGRRTVCLITSGR